MQDEALNTTMQTCALGFKITSIFWNETLKTEALSSSETLIFYSHITRHHIAEVGNLHIHRLGT
jgi:hypothetical protein